MPKTIEMKYSSEYEVFIHFVLVFLMLDNETQCLVKCKSVMMFIEWSSICYVTDLFHCSLLMLILSKLICRTIYL